MCVPSVLTLPISRDPLCEPAKDLQKSSRDRLKIFAPELTDRIVIGMRVAREVANRNTTLSRTLDFTRTEDPVAIKVDQQGQHHVAASAQNHCLARSDEINPLDRFDHEMNHRILGHPITQIRR